MSSRTRTGHLAEPQAGLEVGRRNFLKLTGAGVAAGVVSAMEAPVSAQQTLAWDKTFPKSDRVDHRKVTFYNRLGITLVADLYVPQAIDRSQRHPALVVGGPYGAVKEQSSGLYAQTMAERGLHHHRSRSLLRRRKRRPAARDRLLGSPRRGLQRRGRLSGRAVVRRSRADRRDRCVRQRRFRLGGCRDRPSHQGGRDRQHVRHRPGTTAGLGAHTGRGRAPKDPGRRRGPALGRGGWGGAGHGDWNAPSAHRVVRRRSTGSSTITIGPHAVSILAQRPRSRARALRR